MLECDVDDDDSAPSLNTLPTAALTPCRRPSPSPSLRWVRLVLPLGADAFFRPMLFSRRAVALGLGGHSSSAFQPATKAASRVRRLMGTLGVRDWRMILLYISG